MAKVPDGIDARELTIAARRVLLDGLVALSDQLDALTVVGAQAVHLRTPDTTLHGATFTSDGDISIDPELLGDRPRLDEALQGAGFELLRRHEPGLWARAARIGDKTVPIEFDLLMGKTLAPAIGRRSAKVPPHDVMSARWVPGLEVAAVDRSPMRVPSLEAGDHRSVMVNVAGPAALLVAKAFKINDRVEQAEKRPDRLTDKDAGDVLRIMRSVPAREVAESFALLRKDPRVGAITSQGAELLHRLFGARRTVGVDMAVQALRGDMPEDRVRALAPAYVSRLR
ncbi:hypothetical protein [Streptomyces sp. NRRL F-5135]|uniref:hypothetical protein n=1 Tax=Streptomyces sp. NRRL F-5135 TaxID=1463858 RepID=UPI0004C6CEC2|nr:hypothetical protein [Streptomyces sp. NRRL F-5135]